VRRPSELEKLQPLAVHDAALQSLAAKSHPQQRRQLLHVHKRQLEEFFRDSNLQWDNDSYVTSRYSQARYPQSLHVTPEIQKNIEEANGADGGNAPLPSNRTAPDKMCISELQLHLSNQAAMMRRNMAKEYEDLREFQNSELKLMLQAKAAKEPEFNKLVEEARKNPQRLMSRTMPKPGRRESAVYVQPIPRTQTVQQKSVSPVRVQSPLEYPDLQALKSDPSLSPFFKFFLNLRVVQQNWPAVSREWPQYIAFFQRKLMTEKAFAKAVLEDAVRTNVAYSFRPDLEHIDLTRGLAQSLPETYVMSRLVIDVVLEMAAEGNIEHSNAASESKAEIFGPRIIMDAMNLETQSQTNLEPQLQTENITKATDPRNRM
jgi:hypothetical protein